MARNSEESAESTGAETAAAGTEGGATEGTAAAAEGQTRAQVILTLDQEAATALGGEAKVGDTIKRKDYCVKRFGQGVERGPIAKELTRLEGRKVAYQIVFQATKGAVKGTPAAAPAAEGAAAEAVG